MNRLLSLFTRHASPNFAPNHGETPPAALPRPHRSALRPLALEQRFMFDGAAIVATGDAVHDASVPALVDVPAAVEVRAADPSKDNGRKEVVVVDTSVADYKALEASIAEGIGIIEIDGSQDGLAQLAKWAASQSGYDSISILSHGAEGTLHLGSSMLTNASLCNATVQAELAQIGQALTADGDILLYGCDIAKGSDGTAFIADLAQATGADVAASTDTTGASTQGGDWTLETTTGTIDVRSLALTDYQSVLSTISFSSSDTDIGDYEKTSFTRTETTSGQAITFTELGTSCLAYDGNGLYSMDETSTGVALEISAPSGYTFDITSFGAQMNTGQLQIKLTYANGQTATFTQTGISDSALTTVSVLGGNNTPINDVTKIELTSSAYGVFNNFVITDVKAPPSFTGSYTGNLLDTEVANSFSNVTGTLTATPSSVTSNPIASYGISGGTTGTYNVGGSSYDITKAGGYGTLYLNSSTGAYVYVPNGAAIEELSTETVGGFANRVTKVDSFAVTAKDSAGATAENAVSISLTGQNDTPEITSGASATVAENSTGTIYTATASDRDSGQALSYSLSGDDAGLFNINASTGEVSFINAPNYEAPSDKDGNNVYDITVTATDNAPIVPAAPVPNDSVPKAVSITVTNVNEAPTITAPSPIAVTEDVASALTGISLADVDAGSASLTATLTVGSGALAATSSGGVTVGGTSSAMTLTGSLTDINVFISGGKVSFTTASNATSDVTLTVEIKDGGNTGAGGEKTASKTVTLAVTAVNDAPLNTVIPALSGTASIGNTLSASSGTWNDVDGGTLTYSYQWYRADDASGTNAVAIGGATSSTYTLVSADASKYLRVVVTANDGQGSSTKTADSAWAQVENAAPTLSVAPAISGTASLGNALTASSGTWSDMDGDTLTYSYQWYRADDASGTNAVAIGGATSSTYTLSGPDAHKYLSVVVTADDGKAHTPTANSAWTPVSNAAPVLVAPTAITLIDTAAADSFAKQTGTLSVSDADGDAITYGISGGTSGSTTLDSVTYDVSKAGAYGTLYLKSSTGDYVYVPDGALIDKVAAGASPTDSFTVTVSDGQSGSDSKTLAVNITGADDAPTGMNVTGSRSASTYDTGTDVIGASLTATGDPDSTTWTYSIQSITLSGSAQANDDSLFSLDTGAAIATASLRITTPNTTTAGSYSIVVRATSSAGVHYEKTVDVVVDNSLIVTTAADEAYGGGTYADELTDGSGLSLAEAMSIANANHGATIRFADGLSTSTVLGAATVSYDTILDFGSASGITLSGNISVDAGKTLTLRNTAGSVTLTGALSGTGGLVKEGAGTLTLSASGTIAATAVKGGVLIAHANSLLNSDVSVESGATLRVAAANLGIASLSGAGSLILDGNLVVGIDDSSTEFSGTISGSSTLFKDGTGTLTLSGCQANIVVKEGGLTVKGGAALSDSRSVNLETGTTLTVNDSETLGNLSGAAGSTIVLNGSTLTFGSSSDLTVASTISGTGGLLKTGIGTLTLSGTNTYNGGTTVSAGTLEIASANAIGSGTLTMANSTSLGVTASLSLTNDIVITNGFNIYADTNQLTLSGSISGGLLALQSGALTLSGNNSFSMLATVGGTVTLQNGSALADGCTVDVSSGTQLILDASETFGGLKGAGRVSLGANTLTIGSVGEPRSFNGVIEGTGAVVIKESNYWQTLSGNNTFTGGLTVKGGTLVLSGGSALSDTTAVTVNTGGELFLNDTETIGTLSGSGKVSLGPSNTLTVNSTSDSTFSGVISGTGLLFKAGTGTLTLSGANTYTGMTSVTGGTLSIATDANLGSGALILANGVTLNVTGATTIDNMIRLPGNATISNANALTISGAILESGDLIKTGAGTLTLSGNNSYTGSTTVSAGTLLVNSALSGTSGITVASGATLGGTGTLFGAGSSNTLTVNGTLAPGSSGSGILTVNGNLVLNGTLAVDVAGSTAGTGYDQVSVAGTVTLGAASSLSLNNTLSGPASSLAVIKNDAVDLIAGTFVGLAEGATPAGAPAFTVSYIGDTGNDLVLSLKPAPVVTSVSASTVDGTYKTGDTITLTVTLDHAVTVTGTPTLTLANGGTASYSSGSGTDTLSFTYTVGEGQSTADLDYATTGALALAGGSIKAPATGLDATLTLAAPGAASSLGANKAIVIDAERPTASIVVADTELTTGETSLVTITFSEAVTGFDNSDLTVEGGTLSAVISSDGGLTWTAIFAPTANLTDTTNVITLNNAGVTDLVGNAGTGTTPSNNYAVATLPPDTTPPTASIVVADTELTVGEISQVTITFSEAVTGFDNSDLTVEGGALSVVSSSDGGITWTAAFTPTANLTDTTNVITLNNAGVTDLAGNAGTGTTQSNNYAVATVPPDTVPLTASIVVADTELTEGETSLVTITFSEAVTGFDNSDLTVEGGTLSAVSSSDGGLTWKAIFTPTANLTDTTNVITLNNAGVSDLAGNAGTGATQSNNYAVATLPPDTTPPTASIVVADTELTEGETSQVTITFSEAVTGFNNSDLTVEGGTLSAVISSDGGITWTATFTPTANLTDTTNVITLNNGGVTDLAGNTGTGTTPSNNYAVATMLAPPNPDVVQLPTSSIQPDTSPAFSPVEPTAPPDSESFQSFLPAASEVGLPGGGVGMISWNTLPPMESGFSSVAASGDLPTGLVRSTGSQGDALVVSHGVPDVVVDGAGTVEARIPVDAFAHTDPRASVQLSLSLTDGRALPTWVAFDPLTGKLKITPPPGFEGVLELEVTARDEQGNEAKVAFRVVVGRNGQAAERPVPAGRAGLSEQFRLAARSPYVADRLAAFARAGEAHLAARARG